MSPEQRAQARTLCDAHKKRADDCGQVAAYLRLALEALRVAEESDRESLAMYRRARERAEAAECTRDYMQTRLHVAERERDEALQLLEQHEMTNACTLVAAVQDAIQCVLDAERERDALRAAGERALDAMEDDRCVCYEEPPRPCTYCIAMMQLRAALAGAPPAPEGSPDPAGEEESR